MLKSSRLLLWNLEGTLLLATHQIQERWFAAPARVREVLMSRGGVTTALGQCVFALQGTAHTAFAPH